MLEKDFQYYLHNQEELVKKYEGKYLVIKNEQVIGVYKSTEEAYLTSIKEHEEGTFLIQLCESGESSYTQTFHSRIVFV